MLYIDIDGVMTHTARTISKLIGEKIKVLHCYNLDDPKCGLNKKQREKIMDIIINDSAIWVKKSVPNFLFIRELKRINPEFEFLTVRHPRDHKETTHWLEMLGFDNKIVYAETSREKAEHMKVGDVLIDDKPSMYWEGEIQNKTVFTYVNDCNRFFKEMLHYGVENVVTNTTLEHILIKVKKGGYANNQPIF